MSPDVDPTGRSVISDINHQSSVTLHTQAHIIVPVGKKSHEAWADGERNSVMSDVITGNGGGSARDLVRRDVVRWHVQNILAFR